ncbi:LuxR C-terminal-related transcriptional regulator [Desulfitobacterium metallireducens]|uniref:Stage 0 sporulation protein A homolog n=1 Tax=Desulfitobacterium metallireducens DSM 15288 TaxID=871968 RepID=W0E8M7_9FIRM|nr:response regulator transcription factor [Desulfitobacterium metallireducens]AHF07190.1 regulator [Desulfitobacterium metallireducens DSM 15288]
MSVQILLADENYIQLEGLKKLFETVEDIQVRQTVRDVQETVNKISESQPDIIMMDLHSPICNGIRAIRQIHTFYPKIRILILTNLCSIEAIRSAIEAGASGYLLKQCSFKELLHAIRAISQGNSYFHPMVSKLIVNGIMQHGHEVIAGREMAPCLTDREMEVLHLAAEGLTNQEIAKQLFISTKTVQTHRRNIMDKLGFHDRVDLVKYAIRKGIIALQE